MQNLVAILLLVLSSCFLLLKWMPKSVKNKITANYASRFPTLAPLFIQVSKSSEGCGSGCNSCSSNENNACSSVEAKPVKFIQIKNIAK